MASKKIKILYLITKDDVGGAQKYVADLTHHLDPQKFDVKILTGGKGGLRFLSNAFMPYLFFANDWLAVAEIFLKLQRLRPDILHLNSSKAGVIGALAARLAGIPQVVFTAHGWVFNPDNNLSIWRRWFYVALHKIASRLQDKIINVSEYDRQLALKYKIAPAAKLTTVRIGLNLNELKFLDKNTARKVLGKLSGLEIKVDDVWVGSIGRLVAEKSYTDLIEAAASVANPKVKFFIIGSGYEKNKLQNRIKKLGLENRFALIGEVAPAAPYLKAFDIFMLSSVKEGLPYTLLEAMAAEIPIITTRVGGMPEIISGRGLVMPPREPEELARAINYLLDNFAEAKKMASAGAEYLRVNLSLPQMLTATQTIYESLLL